MLSYTKSVYSYRRRKTVEVKFGNIKLGGVQPIRVESMTTADTMNTEAVVEQSRRLYEANCEIIRITAPSIKSAENLKNIRDILRKDGIQTPLVADIHFTPKAAMKAVEFVENVRINPGNYSDRKRFNHIEFTDAQYQEELERLHDEFKPLVLKAKEYGVSMRIGTNHGSLSDRIMSRYGDTPLGMVESALEFARVCEMYDYYDVLFSMKSSNVRVMIEAYRLLAAQADRELKYAYPLHLGVTEAGDGDEGRIKSSMGIGALLEDGLGDTIRVSLTEDPVKEVPIGYDLVKKYNDRLNLRSERTFEPINQAIAPELNQAQTEVMPYDPYDYRRRDSLKLNLAKFDCGGDSVPRVELDVKTSLENTDAARAEILAIAKPNEPESIRAEFVNLNVCSADEFLNIQNALGENANAIQLCATTSDLEIAKALVGKAAKIRFEIVEGEMLEKDFLTALVGESLIEFSFKKENATVRAAGEVLSKIASKCKAMGFEKAMFSVQAKELVFATRYLVRLLNESALNFPVMLRYNGKGISERQHVLVDSAIQAGTPLADGIGDVISLSTDLTHKEELNFAYSILQAARIRISKTEFISCPGCGRTLFDLEETTGKIKTRTSHLKGLKIGIMGCIVNGPGEMADADFGYVGTGHGEISLYVGKECVQRHIPEDEAVGKLIELIKEYGKWQEPKEKVEV